MSTESPYKRVTDNARRYSGEQDALPLVEWLNRNGETRAARRVVRLITALNAPPDIESAEYKTWRSGTDRTLGRYRYSPQISVAVHRPSGNQYRVSMVPSRWLSGKGGAVENREPLAVLQVVRLAELGLVDRVRRCSCGAWFFAHASTKQWCSVKCRHRDYKSTPEWKEKRNRYARDYYRDNFMGARRDKSQRKRK